MENKGKEKNQVLAWTAMGAPLRGGVVRGLGEKPSPIMNVLSGRSL